jgi:hypothetical protein
MADLAGRANLQVVREQPTLAAVLASQCHAAPQSSPYRFVVGQSCYSSSATYDGLSAGASIIHNDDQHCAT